MDLTGKIGTEVVLDPSLVFTKDNTDRFFKFFRSFDDIQFPQQIKDILDSSNIQIRHLSKNKAKEIVKEIYFENEDIPIFDQPLENLFLPQEYSKYFPFPDETNKILFLWAISGYSRNYRPLSTVLIQLSEGIEHFRMMSNQMGLSYATKNTQQIFFYDLSISLRDAIRHIFDKISSGTACLMTFSPITYRLLSMMVDQVKKIATLEEMAELNNRIRQLRFYPKENIAKHMLKNIVLCIISTNPIAGLILNIHSLIPKKILLDDFQIKIINYLENDGCQSIDELSEIARKNRWVDTEYPYTRFIKKLVDLNSAGMIQESKDGQKNCYQAFKSLRTKK